MRIYVMIKPTNTWGPRLSQILRQLKIVYAEDEQIIRENLATYLRNRVGAIHEASNGKEALELIREVRPNFVLTDLEMPKMNGQRLITAIREEQGNAFPILVITGYHDDDHKTVLADGTIVKPFDLDQLIATMENLAKQYKIVE